MIKNNTNRIVKQGNAHSSLLDQIVKIAEAEDTPKPSAPTFEEHISEVLAQKDKEPTLREILAQFAPPAPAPPAAAKPMDVSDGLGDLGSGDLGSAGEEPIPGEGGESPMGDIEGAKRNLAQALVDLCGGADEAMLCVTSCGDDSLPEVGEELDGEIPDEPTDPMMAAPMEEPAPMEAPAPTGEPSPMKKLPGSELYNPGEVLDTM